MFAMARARFVHGCLPGLRLFTPPTCVDPQENYGDDKNASDFPHGIHGWEKRC
jgi:hypothetical protein